MTVAARAVAVPVRGATARVCFGGRFDGDHHVAHVAPPVLAARRQAMAPLPWTWLDQVHASRVVTVTHPGDQAGATADAAVTSVHGAVLGLWVGDCAPVVLVSSDGVIGAAHAGWRGIAAGILPATVAAMRRLGARELEAHIGPHLHASCYEFGTADLAALAARLGDGVRATTSWGTPALDLAEAVRASLSSVDVDVVASGPCTSCDGRYWSYRGRGDLGRQAAAVWLEPA